MDTRAILVSLAMLGALVSGTGPAAARPGAVSYVETFSSAKRLHPRFPADFPIPAIFVLEHSTGGLRHGTITLRFRFRGDPIQAVDALRDAAGNADWSMEQELPYRILFHKDTRTIAAWFGFPSRSLVLDVHESAGRSDIADLPQRRAEREAIGSPSRSGSSRESIPVQPSLLPVGVALALALIGGAIMVHFGRKAKVARAAGRPMVGRLFVDIVKARGITARFHGDALSRQAAGKGETSCRTH